MLYQSASHLQTPNLSWLGLSFCYRSLIYLQLEDRSSQQHNARHNTQLWSCLTHRCVRENVRISFTNYIHNPRAQALPSNTVSYKQKALIVPPILALSLSLLYVLLQQWARPQQTQRNITIMAKTLCYGATYSSLSFCLPQNLSPSLALFAICFCPSTYLLTTLSAFPKTDRPYFPQVQNSWALFPLAQSPKKNQKNPRDLPLPPLGPPRQLSLNSDLLGSSPRLSQKFALQDFPPKIPTVACLASRSSFFLHCYKFKSQNHKMVVFFKSVFRRRHPASCSKGRHQASCSATFWPVTLQPSILDHYFNICGVIVLC
jgi:hypothetical protein